MQTVYTLSRPCSKSILETEIKSGILDLEGALGEVGEREVWFAERIDTARHTRI